MFNPKDIPFAFGYITAIYMTVVWLQQLPVLKWKTTLLLGLCCAAAISFRIGGILVFALTGLMVVWKYLAEKDTRKAINARPFSHLLHLAVVFSVGLLITVLLNPFILQDPVNHFIYAVEVVRKFPQSIPLMFRGKEYVSTNVPPGFIPQWMSVSIPVMVLLLLVLSCIFLCAF